MAAPEDIGKHSARTPNQRVPKLNMELVQQEIVSPLMNPESCASGLNSSGDPVSGKNRLHNMTAVEPERYATFGGQKMMDKNKNNMTTINNNNHSAFGLDTLSNITYDYNQSTYITR